ncbi:MAG: AIR synthase-related protein, partial [Candidatus Binatia bacterium]
MDVGLLIHPEAVPVYPETRAICNHYGLDPMGLIASGALLIVLGADQADRVLARLQSEGIAATIIGQITDRNEGVKLITRSGIRDLPIYERDELTRIPESKLFSAHNSRSGLLSSKSSYSTTSRKSLSRFFSQFPYPSRALPA